MNEEAQIPQTAGPVEAGLGTRIAARFSEIGLEEEIPELRGQSATPADL
jgi:hypothetical protein